MVCNYFRTDTCNTLGDVDMQRHLLRCQCFWIYMVNISAYVGIRWHATTCFPTWDKFANLYMYDVPNASRFINIHCHVIISILAGDGMRWYAATSVTMLILVNLITICGGTYSLEYPPNRRFLRNISWRFIYSQSSC